MAANEGIVPINTDTLVGQVRLLVGDTDPQPLIPDFPGKGTYLWYSDTEIAGLAGLYGQNPRRVAAQILRSISFSQVMLLKKFTSAELAVDGAAIADSIRLLAKDLDEQADVTDAKNASEAFKIVPTGGVAWETWQTHERYTGRYRNDAEALPAFYYPVI